MRGITLTAIFLAFNPDASIETIASALGHNRSTVKTWLSEVRRIAAEFERQENEISEK